MTCLYNYKTSLSSLQGEMLLFAAYGDQHRDPQLVKIQRVRDCGIFSPKCNIFVIPHPPKVQGSLMKSDGKIVKD